MLVKLAEGLTPFIVEWRLPPRGLTGFTHLTLDREGYVTPPVLSAVVSLHPFLPLPGCWLWVQDEKERPCGTSVLHVL